MARRQKDGVFVSDKRFAYLLSYIEGTKDILEGRCKGASVTNALLNLDDMERIVRELRDSPGELGNYSGDIEYHVENQASETYTYESLEAAGAAAFAAALVRGAADVDVVIFTEKAPLRTAGSLLSSNTVKTRTLRYLSGTKCE